MYKYTSYALLVIIMAVLPSLHIIPALEVYDDKRVFQVGLLLVVGLLFTSGQYLRWGPLEKWTPSGLKLPRLAQWGLTIFFTVGLISTAINGNWYHGLQELSLYILLFCFMLFTAQIYLQQPVQFEKGMGLLLLLFGGLYTLKFFIGYGMYWFIDYPLWPGQSYQYKLFGFANVRFLNQIQVWSLPLLIVGSIVTNKSQNYAAGLTIGKKSKWLFFGIVSLWLSLIIQSGGRGAILSLLFSAIIILITFKKKAHQYIYSFLYSFIGGWILKFILFDLLSGNNGVSKSLSRGGSGRLEVWHKTIWYALQKPIFGHGPMQSASINLDIIPSHPHNSILQLSYEFGVPTTLLIVGLVCWGLYKWFCQSKKLDNVNQQQANIRIGVSTSLLAGLGYSLFSGVIVMPLSQLWMALIGGCLLGIYIKNRPIKFEGEGQKISREVVKGLVILAIAFMSYSLIHDVQKLDKNQQQYQEEYGGKYHPRFWQQGKILE